MDDRILVDNSPAVPGLVFRRFRGDSDYPHMAAVVAASAEADHIERTDTPETIAKNYQNLTNCDPYQDMLFAEVDGEVIGYERGWWWDDSDEVRIYASVGFLSPGWRRKGIGGAMLGWVEERLRQVAEGHPLGPKRYFQNYATQFQPGNIAMLEGAGYTAMRHFYDMLRPTLEDIPNFPLPEGVQLRPVQPEHYPAIWASIHDVSREEWGYQPPSEADYRAWLEDERRFQPQLWQIAWDSTGERVVGHVMTFIDYAENEKYKRKRGYTEGIGVDRAWRRRGLAKALIARSLQAQVDAGMLESALAVDSENRDGATRLYESCGFQVVRRDAVYRKSL